MTALILPSYIPFDPTGSGIENIAGLVSYDLDVSYNPVIAAVESTFSKAPTTVTAPLWDFYISAEDITTVTGTEGMLTTGVSLNYIPSGYTLYQIWSTDEYTFAATNEGLEIYKNTYDSLYYTMLEDNVVTTVFGSEEEDLLYVGTTVGIYKGEISTLETNSSIPVYVDLNLESEYVKYIHGKEDMLLIATTSGVEFIDKRNNPNIHSKCTISGINKCFITDNSAYYTSGSYIYRRDNLKTDWYTASYTYTTTGSSIFDKGITINDMYITEGTATNGGNTLFCATSSGIYVVDEDSGEYIIYYTR